MARTVNVSEASDWKWRERLLPPPFLNQLLERKWLGDKTGQGFYKRVGKEREIHAIDWKTLEYHPAAKVKFPSAEAARNVEDLPARLAPLEALAEVALAWLAPQAAPLPPSPASPGQQAAPQLANVGRAR